MIIFLSPLYFLLLIPIILLIILLYFNSLKKINFWNNIDLIKIFKKNSFYFKLYIILIFLISFLFIAILANPVKQNILQKNTKNWIDIQIILDISYSMIATDLKPNRLEVAKNVIWSFIKKIKNDRIWIIVFAWKTFTSVPLSFDYKIIQNILSKITVDTINQKYNYTQWTSIWDALIHGWESFWNEKNREKIIILLTDWEVNKWIDPLIAIQYLKEKIKNDSLQDKNIKIYTIWIWWDKEAFIENKDNFWRIHKTKVAPVDEKTLKSIAKITWWKYFKANKKQTFKKIFNEISKIEKTEIQIENIKINIPKYSYFLYILIFMYLMFLYLKFKKTI